MIKGKQEKYVQVRNYSKCVYVQVRNFKISFTLVPLFKPPWIQLSKNKECFLKRATILHIVLEALNLT